MPYINSTPEFTDEELKSEEWRDVVGYEGSYRVSSLGRVYSIPRPKLPRGHMKVLYINPQGYPTVSLHQKRHQSTFKVHTLVTAAFIGPRPLELVTRHLDGVSVNSKPSNLRYGTRSENAEDCVRHGRNKQANQTHCVNGHPFSPENTKLRKGKFRQCLTCHRAWNRKYMSSRRAKASSELQKSQNKAA